MIRCTDHREEGPPCMTCEALWRLWCTMVVRRAVLPRSSGSVTSNAVQESKILPEASHYLYIYIYEDLATFVLAVGHRTIPAAWRYRKTPTLSLHSKNLCMESSSVSFFLSICDFEVMLWSQHTKPWSHLDCKMGCHDLPALWTGPRSDYRREAHKHRVKCTWVNL